MRSVAQTPARSVRDLDSRARARFIAALACSLFVHTLITTGVPPGQRGWDGAGASSLSRAPLTVELLVSKPEPPLVSAPANVEAHTAPAPRPERMKTQELRAAAISAEGPLRAARAGPAHIPDATYYGARQLDVYPMLASTLRLGDRDSASTAPGIGRVLLLVLIDA